jgi:hypothetical protein
LDVIKKILEEEAAERDALEIWGAWTRNGFRLVVLARRGTAREAWLRSADGALNYFRSVARQKLTGKYRLGIGEVRQL